MQLAHELLTFFSEGHTHGSSIYPRSFLEFIQMHPEIGHQVYNNIKYSRKLEQEGLLLNMGRTGDHPYYGHTYYSSKGEYDADLSLYGSYELLVKGFLSVRQRFKSMCLPISVVKQNEDLSIGSSFIYDSSTIITARHCVEGHRSFKILDVDRNCVPVDKIFFSANSNLDLAVIKTPDNFFQNFQSFSLTPKPEWKGSSPIDTLNFVGEPSIVLLSQSKTLDDILTLGYPPISGFEAMLIADKTSINSIFLRSSIGEVLTEQKKIYDDIEYFLINAKVKGGNSGGPVFDKLGCVIGIVIETPMDFENPNEIDKLGYGIVVPSQYIKELLTAIKEGSNLAVVKSVHQFDDGSLSIL